MPDAPCATKFALDARLLIAIGLALVSSSPDQPVKVEGTACPLLSTRNAFHQQIVYRFEPIQRGDVVVSGIPRSLKIIHQARVGLPGEAVEFAGRV